MRNADCGMKDMFRALSVVLVLASGAAFTGAGPKVDARAELDLTADEHRMVVDLVEKTLKEKGVFKGKTYLTQLEVHRDTRDAESPRNALVVHYRYEGNLAIFTSVNIGRKEVTRVESEPDCPTCLAPEELARAIKLAHASPEV